MTEEGDNVRAEGLCKETMARQRDFSGGGRRQFQMKETVAE